jgi:ATP-binding cassette subfamily B protein
MYSSSVHNALQSALLLPLILTLGSVSTGFALVIGGFDVGRGAISVGTLIAFLTYVRHFFDPVQELGHWFAEIQMASASAERVLGLIETVPTIRDGEDVLARISARAENGASGVALAEDGLPDEIGTIDFERVAFAYEGGAPVLDDFNLSVRAGETIALVGPTGGGKSTIVSLLCRFYEPTGGEIRIDGVDYRRRGLHWLQSNLGIVLQTPHLFSGTVADNIRYGRLEATDDEIRQAAKIVGAHAFVEQMEHGYESEVGEGGVLLSTGEKQLISFARAILARPRILVMDEATSSVDTKTEHAIQVALGRVLEGRTSFVVAHRLSTIRSADRILVIDGGRIAEEGSHAALMQARGRYHDLYVQQSLRESSRALDGWDSDAPEPAAG